MFAAIDAESSLDDIHCRLRRGDFGADLLGIVRAHAEVWKALPEPLRLKAAYVVSEVLDYFGEYEEAASTVVTIGREQRDLVQALGRKARFDDDPSVSVRRIWVTLAFATTLYRRESYGDTLAVLEDCRSAVEVLDPKRQALFGTRARLAHSLGQALRQLHKYESARREFEDAIGFARQRLVVKTPHAELPAAASLPLTSSGPQYFDEQTLLAQWTIGKCLALGLGWIAYTTGLLSSASMLLSAGYTLLRGTRDGLHRAYAMLLLGAVERAFAGEDRARLEKSITIMQDAETGLAKHRMFALRACYELALAYCKLPERRDEARQAIATLKKGLGGSEQRSARWMSTALAVESRIERLDGNLGHAKNLADRAVEQAEKAGADWTEIRAEALIALGEAFLAQARLAEHHKTPGAGRYREHAIDRFTNALALGRDNPKIAAVCHLHLAHAYCLHGSLREAHTEREASTLLKPIVEHGFVHGLAKTVEAEIRKHDCFFIGIETKSLIKQDHLARLEAFLLRQAKTRGDSSTQWALILGVSKSTVKKMQRRLEQAKEPIGERRPVGRPRKERPRR